MLREYIYIHLENSFHLFQSCTPPRFIFYFFYLAKNMQYRSSLFFHFCPTTSFSIWPPTHPSLFSFVHKVIRTQHPPTHFFFFLLYVQPRKTYARMPLSTCSNPRMFSRKILCENAEWQLCSKVTASSAATCWSNQIKALQTTEERRHNSKNTSFFFYW